MPLPGGRGPRFGVDAAVGTREQYVDRQRTQSPSVLTSNISWYYSLGDSSPVNIYEYDLLTLYFFPLRRYPGSMTVSSFIFRRGNVEQATADSKIYAALYRYAEVGDKFKLVGNINATRTSISGGSKNKPFTNTLITPEKVDLSNDNLFLAFGITYDTDGSTPTSYGVIAAETYSSEYMVIPNIYKTISNSYTFEPEILSSALTSGIQNNIAVPMPAVLFLSETGARMFGVD